MGARPTTQQVPIGGKMVTLPMTSTLPRRINVTEADMNPAGLSRILAEIQQAVSDATRAARSNPFAGAVLLRGVNLKTGQGTAVQHGLGRPFLNWLIVRKNALGDVFEFTQAASQNASQVTLFATGNMTVDLLVW